MQKKIVVLGSINTDLIYRCSHLPVPGETILGEDVVVAGGGKGANQAVAAARLGGKVVMVGKVGADANGIDHIKNFKKEGIDPQNITKEPDHPTGTAVILLDEQGQNSIVVSPGANRQILSEDVKAVRAEIESASVLVLQLEIPLEAVITAAQIAKDAGVPVMFNPAPAVPLVMDLLKNIDTLVVNETEMEIITGVDITDHAALSKAVVQILNSGVRQIILTLGQNGCRWYHQDQEKFVSAYAVQAVDTTAAGDCFVGALATVITAEKTIDQQLAFASAAAALAVTKLGAQPSLPYLIDVEKFLLNRHQK